MYWTSFVHYVLDNQNVMERCSQVAKRLINLVVACSGCPLSFWLLCLQYVCVVLNYTVGKRKE